MTNLATVPSSVQTTLQERASKLDVTATLAAIAAAPCTSPDEVAFMVDLADEARTNGRDLDAQEKSVTKPINDSLKTVRGWFRPLKEAYSAIETAAKARIAEYHQAEAARIQAERAKALEAIQTAAVDRTPENETLARAAICSIPEATRKASATAAATTTEVWHFEVVDPAAVDRVYCSPDPALIRAAVKAGLLEAPGLRIWSSVQVGIRSR